MLSSLSILNKVSSIADSDKLTSFIFSYQMCVFMSRRLDDSSELRRSIFNHSFQDAEGSGISDRPGNMVYVFHTHFGIQGAGVCVPFLIWCFILGFSVLEYPNFIHLDPVCCMPVSFIEGKG